MWKNIMNRKSNSFCFFYMGAQWHFTHPVQAQTWLCFSQSHLNERITWVTNTGFTWIMIHLLYYSRFVPAFRNSDYLFHSWVTAPYLHGPTKWMTGTLFWSEMMIWCSDWILCTTSSIISQVTHFSNL
jgi:hypothetical protein